MNTATVSWTRQPRQARSQRTLDAILDATETLLASCPYDGVSVTAIITRAGSSAGAFYTRFADKQSLLHALHERVAERGIAMAAWLRQAAPKLPDTGTHSANGRAVVRLLVGNLARGHRRNRGVLRAVAIESFRDPRFATRALRIGGELRDAACEVLRPWQGTRSALQFEESVTFALRMTLATLDQQLFVPAEHAPRFADDDATLPARLADAFIRYLQLE